MLKRIDINGTYEYLARDLEQFTNKQKFTIRVRARKFEPEWPHKLYSVSVLLDKKNAQRKCLEAVFGVLRRNYAVRAVVVVRRAQVAPDSDRVRTIGQKPETAGGQRAVRVQREERESKLIGVIGCRDDTEPAIWELHERTGRPVGWNCNTLDFGERAVGRSKHAHAVVLKGGHEALLIAEFEAADEVDDFRELMCFGVVFERL